MIRVISNLFIAVALALPAHATQLLSIDFSSALTTDFNGTTGVWSNSGGTLTNTGEGGILAKTSLGTGNKWMRVQIPVRGASGGNSGFALGDASGNLVGWIVDRLASGALVFDNRTDYSTYNSWNADNSNNINVSTFTAGQYVGITLEPSTNSFRIWVNVTAAEPTSVTSWDSRAADATNTAATFKANSAYVGFIGFSSSGDGTNSYDNFTAGDFSTSGGGGATSRMPLMGVGP